MRTIDHKAKAIKLFEKANAMMLKGMELLEEALSEFETCLQVDVLKKQKGKPLKRRKKRK